MAEIKTESWTPEKISWDEIPEILTKEQLYKLCHISKATARKLLLDGTIPCEYSGGKTRCFKIKKSDVRKYMEKRLIQKEKAAWKLCPKEFKAMSTFYQAALANYPDVLTVAQISEFTGYGLTSVNNWCRWGWLSHLKIGKANRVPKIFFIEFLCSSHFISIRRKNARHCALLKGIREWEGK